MASSYYIAQGKSEKLVTGIMRKSGDANWKMSLFVRQHAPWADWVTYGKDGKIVALSGKEPTPAESWVPYVREGSKPDDKPLWQPSESAVDIRKAMEAVPPTQNTHDVGKALFDKDVSVVVDRIGSRLYLEIDAELGLPTPAGAVPVSKVSMDTYRRSVKRNEKMSKLADDQNLRIGKMIWLAGVNAAEPTDELQEFFEEHTDKQLEEIFGMKFGIEKEKGLGRREREESRRSQIAETLYDSKVFGFLVCFETPVRSRFSDKGSFTYSWGHYHMKWVYAETLAKAMREGQKWVKQQAVEDETQDRAKKQTA